MTANDYRVPGVYWEEIFPRKRVPLPTGVPVFIGMVPLDRAPSGVPGLEDSGAVFKGAFDTWQEFESAYGVLEPLGYLGYSVRGFFRNGGGTCHVLICLFRSGETLEAVLGRALDAAMALDDADLVCVPDLMWLYRQGAFVSREEAVSMQKTVLDWCAVQGGRFAILDSLPGLDPSGVKEQRGGLRDSPWGALYYPWVRVPGGPGEDGADILPPCGHVAGVYARTDRDVGVHKAPANEVLEEVVGLEARVTAAVQAGLNPLGVNCIRAFPGRGIRVWGARTLGLDPGLVYVNVRRLIGTVGRWVDYNMAHVVFEPNNQRLWTGITRDLTAFLGGLFHRGALAGTTWEEAFYVKCDDETNPKEVRAAGQVVTEIGLAPTVPGEFVVVRVRQDAGGTVLSLAAAPGTSPVPGPGPGGGNGHAWEGPSYRFSIVSVEFNPPGRDISGEYVLLQNQEERPVDMTGWMLHDLAYNTFVFPAFTISPGAFVRVWTREGEDTATDLYWGRRAPVWNNLGDRAFLRDRDGRLVAEYAVGSVRHDV